MLILTDTDDDDYYYNYYYYYYYYSSKLTEWNFALQQPQLAPYNNNTKCINYYNM